jgi:hypothetical protein
MELSQGEENAGRGSWTILSVWATRLVGAVGCANLADPLYLNECFPLILLDVITHIHCPIISRGCLSVASKVAQKKGGFTQIRPMKHFSPKWLW